MAPPRYRMRVWTRRLRAFPCQLRDSASRPHGTSLRVPTTRERQKKPWGFIPWRSVTGLTAAGPAIANGVTWPRVLAAALSLGLTAGLMILFRTSHAPAGA